MATSLFFYPLAPNGKGAEIWRNMVRAYGTLGDRAAAAEVLRQALGPSAKVKIVQRTTSDSTRVAITLPNALIPVDDGDLVIPTNYAAISSILATDADSGNLWLQFEKSDASFGVQMRIARSGQPAALSGHLIAEGQIGLGVIRLGMPRPAGGAGLAPLGFSGYGGLIFQDEFNGSSLDTSKWTKSLWYRQPHSTINYDVSGGSLRIWPVAPDFPYFDATTDGKFQFQYGVIEARMKLPRGRGLWPALWLLNHVDPMPVTDGRMGRPEIDIFEAYSGVGAAPWATPDLRPNAFGITVWTDNGSDQNRTSSSAGGTNIIPTSDLSADFHTWGLKWTASTLEFRFDGNVVKTAPNLIKQPMFVIIGFGFGGISGQPNSGETPTGPSNALLTDYVRVWSLA